MIIDLPSTTTAQVNSKLVEVRETGGAVALGRVLTLVIVTDDSAKTEDAIQAANEASREHPCRVIVLARGARKAAARLDAQIRVGGDAGASDVIVLRLYGPLADQAASCVVPLLLPDAPVVAWWPSEAPDVPSEDSIGQLATRRITDSAAEKNPIKALEQRRKSYVDGDTDLAWTRLTNWRAQLASALDLPPYEKVTAATVVGEADSPSSELLAGWFASRLNVPVSRAKATSGEGIVQVTLQRRSGAVDLLRPDAKTGTLTQPGQPDRRIALQRRSVRDCLAEELRRLDPDEIYEAALKAVPKVTKGRVATSSSKPAAKPAPAKASAESKAKAAAETKAKAEAPAAEAKPKRAAAKKATAKAES
ncbi:glucose-6-phosphate dehydrogenase assembly protein OpcA [Kutzneria kofuensis]|uniref:Glucose-6-phosphate dehydrogenase assembly protein OpcA n=1 Tax=Kutzneria kofuensis TaxID=103725 RepID=A0A7W9NEL6_9PSEU|nr:glucose-6-phosphate dehydrogenase assembly protein OpcA [Kutzneria kofuensis]MBB5889524.1 glucose-6-phosphate dehydrogenase assembly protein OpcA [Kutzneria kofuensis]